MSKSKTIDAFFLKKKKKKEKKKKDVESNSKMSSSISNPQTLTLEQRPSKMPIIESVDISTIQHDPGLRPQIWEYPINQWDEIRHAYLKTGPYRFIPDSFEYLFSRNKKNRRRFQSSWHKMFNWLKYSPKKDATYCLPCYIFSKKPTG